MLERQAWRLLQDPESLSARVLKIIYYPHTSILHAMLGSQPRQMWRAIVEGRDTLKQGLIKRIGNGESTYIWEDNWLLRKEMMRPYGCISANPPLRIPDLIDATNATWNKQLLDATFMPFDVSVITNIPICTMNMPDFWSWAHDRSGQFSVRSAYNMLVTTRNRREAWLEGSAGSSSARTEEGSWKSLWKTEVSAKVRMFLWRLSK